MRRKRSIVGGQDTSLSQFERAVGITADMNEYKATVKAFLRHNDAYPSDAEAMTTAVKLLALRQYRFGSVLHIAHDMVLKSRRDGCVVLNEEVHVDKMLQLFWAILTCPTRTLSDTTYKDIGRLVRTYAWMSGQRKGWYRLMRKIVWYTRTNTRGIELQVIVNSSYLIGTAVSSKFEDYATCSKSLHEIDLIEQQLTFMVVELGLPINGPHGDKLSILHFLSSYEYTTNVTQRTLRKAVATFLLRLGADYPALDFESKIYYSIESQLIRAVVIDSWYNNSMVESYYKLFDIDHEITCNLHTRLDQHAAALKISAELQCNPVFRIMHVHRFNSTLAFIVCNPKFGSIYHNGVEALFGP